MYLSIFFFFTVFPPFDFPPQNWMRSNQPRGLLKNNQISVGLIRCVTTVAKEIIEKKNSRTQFNWKYSKLWKYNSFFFFWRPNIANCCELNIHWFKECVAWVHRFERKGNKTWPPIDCAKKKSGGNHNDYLR